MIIKPGGIYGLFTSVDISASGLTAQRTRMNITASNIANAEATRTEKGGPYRRQQAILSAGERPQFLRLLQEEQMRLMLTKRKHIDNDKLLLLREEYAQGVRVEQIYEDQAPPRLEYDPTHPDADENGMVAYPNVNVLTEMVNMIAASRAYEANVTAMDAAKNMMEQALQI